VPPREKYTIGKEGPPTERTDQVVSYRPYTKLGVSRFRAANATDPKLPSGIGGVLLENATK